MDLIEYKRNNSRCESFPAIGISTKGAMRFNKALVDALQLKAGDKVSFFQDRKQPIDWYMKFGQGATLRKPVTDNGSLVFNFSEVARKIAQAIQKDRALIRVATTPVEDGYYAILTRSV